MMETLKCSRKMVFSGLALLVGLFLFLSFFAGDGLRSERRLLSQPQITLNIKGQLFSLWLAGKPAERQLGLKGVSPEALRPGPQGVRKGMLFIYPESWILAFSMGDVAMPLDLLFISSQGILLHAETMQVNSEKTYTWPVPAKYAMELPQGSRDDLGLQPGDVIIARERLRDLDDL